MREIDEPVTFSEAASGVHRQISTPIGHPALVRHLCLWETSTRTEEDRAKQVNEYLESLRSIIISSSAVSPVGLDLPPNFVIEPHSRSQSTRLGFFWHHIRTSIGLEYHAEYVTLSCVLDFSFFPDRDAKFDIANLRLSDPIFYKIYENLISLLKNRDENRLRNLNAFLYGVVWNNFFRSIVDNHHIMHDPLGKIVGDFRGIITGQPLHDGFERALQIHPVTDVEFSQPFTKQSNIRGLPHDYRRPEKPWRKKVVNLLLPFLKADPVVSEFECTASAFLGGRVVYLSALGPPDLTSRPRTYVPVCFYMHSATDDPWNIGRLVDQMTRLGTLRLVSVFQLNALHRANATLTEIRHEIIRLMRRVSSITALIPLQTDSERREFKIQFREISEKLSELAQKRVDIDEPFRGGLEYRVQRNQYYMSSFYSMLPLIKERKVEGYQPYSEFIFRRLGESFSYIKAMSLKLAELNAVELELEGAYTSLRMVELTVGIRDVSKETRLNTAAINHEDEEMQSIQGFGEIVLVLVLVPYYCSHQLETIQDFVSVIIPNMNIKLAAATIWPVSALLGLLLLLARTQNSIKERSKVRRKYQEERDAATEEKSAKEFWNDKLKSLNRKDKKDKRMLRVAQFVITGVIIAFLGDVVAACWTKYPSEDHHLLSQDTNTHQVIAPKEPQVLLQTKQSPLSSTPERVQHDPSFSPK